MMTSINNFYDKKLSAHRLRQCYEIAPPRVRQYFKAELEFVLDHIEPGDTVLDLGCGYGRTLPPLSRSAGKVMGIDNSFFSLVLAKETTCSLVNCTLVQCDAAVLAFMANTFDVVICIQNGISAFHTDQKELLKESLRVAKPEGTVLYSSYSAAFWDHRLDWFRLQADAGLLGEIDHERTRPGRIVCKDGFTATTMDHDGFLSLAAGLNARASVIEVDNSSVFCRLRK